MNHRNEEIEAGFVPGFFGFLMTMGTQLGQLIGLGGNYLTYLVLPAINYHMFYGVSTLWWELCEVWFSKEWKAKIPV